MHPYPLRDKILSRVVNSCDRKYTDVNGEYVLNLRFFEPKTNSNYVQMHYKSFLLF